jgi:hypothetical protein
MHSECMVIRRTFSTPIDVASPICEVITVLEGCAIGPTGRNVLFEQSECHSKYREYIDNESESGRRELTNKDREFSSSPILLPVFLLYPDSQRGLTEVGVRENDSENGVSDSVQGSTSVHDQPV